VPPRMPAQYRRPVDISQQQGFEVERPDEIRISPDVKQNPAAVGVKSGLARVLERQQIASAADVGTQTAVTVS
jgi:hypothetical protein